MKLSFFLPENALILPEKGFVFEDLGLNFLKKIQNALDKFTCLGYNVNRPKQGLHTKLRYCRVKGGLRIRTITSTRWLSFCRGLSVNEGV